MRRLRLRIGTLRIAGSQGAKDSVSLYAVPTTHDVSQAQELTYISCIAMQHTSPGLRLESSLEERPMQAPMQALLDEGSA